MNSDKLFIIKIGIFTLILLSIKYAISYLLNFNEDIFFKILKLSEIDFYEYAYMVESLSNFNFKCNLTNYFFLLLSISASNSAIALSASF